MSHILAYPCAKPIEAEERGDIRQHWTPLFEAYNVNTVFEHDDHVYKRTRRLRDGEPDPDGGILSLGDGAWELRATNSNGDTIDRFDGDGTSL
ncbi:hypothetical protein [Halostagnicola sp. A-GB9-2]|uniref:hypothetical protein n=1 Tax=Halostagnicola sp. A-GB9-2 TaxID=3048066 RepID=UPI0024BFE3D2|nr:hypothetical protein [Halostagnicola sp. A-GB9-2]MDJ1434601.1 hypothetical protein [Halostagnicola sp. A-GB9-2]